MPSPVLCLADTGWHERHRRLFHVMSALAASRRVYVLERGVRPCRLSLLGAARAGDVTVLTAYLPEGDDRCVQCQRIAPLLEAVLDTDGVLAPLVWVRDAEALPVVERLSTLGTVYDYPARSACPRPTRAERYALRRADVVLAATLAQADWLRRWHPRVQHAPTPPGPGGAAGPRGAATVAATVEWLIDERRRARPAATGPVIEGTPMQVRRAPPPTPRPSVR